MRLWLRIALVVVTSLVAVPAGASSAATAAPSSRGAGPVFLDLQGSTGHGHVVLHGTVVGPHRVLLQRATCRSCSWHRFAEERVVDDAFATRVPSGPAWYRIRSDTHTSWPEVVQRVHGRLVVRDVAGIKRFTEPPRLGHAKGVISWVHATRCDTTHRTMVSAGTVTNRGRTSRDVLIQTYWTPPGGGEVRAHDAVVVLDLPPGATRHWHLESGRPAGKTRCVLTATAGEVAR